MFFYAQEVDVGNFDTLLRQQFYLWKNVPLKIQLRLLDSSFTVKPNNMASNMMQMARCAIRRGGSLMTRQQVRSDSWFTKYREPPNGFLFNKQPRKPGESITARWEYWEPAFWAGMLFYLHCLFISYSSTHPNSRSVDSSLFSWYLWHR